MKFIFPLLLLLINQNTTTMLFMMILLLISFIVNQNNILSLSSSNNLFFSDSLSNILIMLTITTLILILISSSIFNKIFLLKTSMLLILFLTFSSNNMIQFYVMFETILIPTFLLITFKGKQPERLQASIYMLIYTITGSLPLLLGIIFIKNNNFIMMNIMNNFISIPLMFLLAFLMKLPMFFMHLWLPKAHVEAPLEGSMILAAILLKLGGYGIIRFIPLMMNKIKIFNYWLISISMIGAMFTSMNCIRQKDMKSLVAYSSVAHMGLVLASIMTMNKMGMMGAIIMMISHGLSSSALFFMVNTLYMKSHTRNILMFKGLLKIFPNLSFWWFMFLAANISAPPTTNLMSEILMISSLMNWNLLTMLMLSMISILTAIFSINLYINMNHNMTNMNPSQTLSQKNFMSMFIHLIPMIILITKTEMMI